MNELKPCPFCGGEGRLNHTAIGTQFFPQIVCMKCFLKCEPCQSAAEAIAAWSRRFVCYDKNGKPVYAGDDVKALKGNICRAELAPVIVPLNFKGEDVGFDRRIILGEIELIESESEE